MNNKKDILDELKPYLEPKSEILNLSAEQYRRISEWQDKKITSYVEIIGGLLGGMNAIVEHLEKNEVQKDVLLKIIRNMSIDAHNQFDKIREISIEK